MHCFIFAEITDRVSEAPLVERSLSDRGMNGKVNMLL